MKRIILLFLVLSWGWMYSQEAGNLKGRVTDTDSGEGIPQVLVQVQGISFQTQTDEKGYFILENLPVGEVTLIFTKEGFEPLSLPVRIKPGEISDLGNVLLWKSGETVLDFGIINISEQELESDEESAENISGILQSGQDAFLRAASFQFSPARFSLRGLDSKYSTVYFNGIPMNQSYDGRPQWSTWGGLNDVMRAREFFTGLSASDYGIPGLIGGVNYNIKASDIRKTKKISYSITNRNYRHRAMATYATGLNKKGWAYALLASARYAGEGYFEGTFYNAYSFFGAVEKKINDKHSVNLSVFVTPNYRGKSSPNTMEVYNLKGHRYNAYWGLQDGKKRNARVKKLLAPTAILTHQFKINPSTFLQTSLAYRFLSTANSRIGYYNANNPDPTYYRYLPSYWLSKNNLPEAGNHLISFLNYGQIDWGYLYQANKTNTADNGSARYYLYDDKIDNHVVQGVSLLTKTFSDAFTLNAGIHIKTVQSEGYALMTDLLGAPFFYDKNPYATPGNEDNNLDQPDRKVMENEKFSYNYSIQGIHGDAFVQAQYFSKYFDGFAALSFGQTSYQRNGLYKNPLFVDSYGKSQQIHFGEYALKAGGTYKITGRHMLNANFILQSKAPDMRNVFYNARVSGAVTPQIGNEQLFGYDVSYIYRSPYLKSRLTLYAYNIDNYTEIQRFFAEGISLNGVPGIPSNINGNAFFLTQMVTGESRYHAGLEWGVEAQVTPTWKINGAIALGNHIYSNNPDVYVASDLFNATYLGTSHLMNYKIANGPQNAYSIGVEYRSPHYWFVGVNYNYFENAYISVSPILRTERFYLDPNTNQPYQAINDYRGNADWDIPAVNNQILNELLAQEKLESYGHLNLIGGKSWKIDKYYIGLFAMVNNLFDNVSPTGGYEQSRKASYPELYVEKKILPVPVFGNKYWMSYGRNYYVMLSLRF